MNRELIILTALMLAAVIATALYHYYLERREADVQRHRKDDWRKYLDTCSPE
mgnify:CR=1 FL=1